MGVEHLQVELGAASRLQIRFEMAHQRLPDAAWTFSGAGTAGPEGGRTANASTHVENSYNTTSLSNIGSRKRLIHYALFVSECFLPLHCSQFADTHEGRTHASERHGKETS